MDKILYRFATFDQKSVDVDSRTATLAFSSENPVKRKFGNEILSHRSEDVDLSFLASGNAPLLFEHDAERQIGVIETATIDIDKKGRALVRFSKNPLANEVFNDVVDGIRRNVSVGYSITDVRTEKVNDEVNAFVKWSPKEISIVSIPADSKTGIGRSETQISADLNINTNQESVEDSTVIESSQQTEARKAQQEPAEMPPEMTERSQDNQVENSSKETTMDQNIETLRAEVRKDELTRINTINALCKRHGLETLAEDLIRSEKGLDEVRGIVLDELAKSPKVNAQAQTLGLSDNEVRSFSIARAINAVISGDTSEAGFEMEASRAAAKAMGKPVSNKSIFVPMDVLTRAASDSAITATTATGFVATEHRPGNFLDALFAQTVASRLGVQFWQGLVGDLEVPKFTSQGQAYWVGEGNDVNLSEPGQGSVVMSPKTVGSLLEYTRRMQMQSAPVIEQILRAHLQKVLAGAIDKAIFAAGGSGAPVGLTGATSGVTFLTNPSGAFVYADLKAAVKAVKNANALTDNSKWALSVNVADSLETTEKDSNTAGIYLRGDDGRVAGYEAVDSTNVGEHLIFGDFSNVAVGQWGGIELAVDTSQLFASGGSLIRALADVDVGILRPEGFSGYKTIA